MAGLKSFLRRIACVVAKKFGYSLLTDSEAVCYKSVPAAEMPSFGLRLSDGVELIGLKVWTEGEVPCKKHCYHKVKALNSHVFAVKSNSGAKEHVDYACCKCTHKLCSAKWEASYERDWSWKPLGCDSGHKG